MMLILDLLTAQGLPWAAPLSPKPKESGCGVYLTPLNQVCMFTHPSTHTHTHTHTHTTTHTHSHTHTHTHTHAEVMFVPLVQESPTLLDQVHQEVLEDQEGPEGYRIIFMTTAH